MVLTTMVKYFRVGPTPIFLKFLYSQLVIKLSGGADRVIFKNLFDQAQCQELKCSKRASGFFTPIGDMAPRAARECCDFVRALS